MVGNNNNSNLILVNLRGSIYPMTKEEFNEFLDNGSVSEFYD